MVKRFNDVLTMLQGETLTFSFKNGEQATALLEDFIYEMQVDKKGNMTDVLVMVQAKWNKKRFFWKFEDISDWDIEINE